ncbi:inositol monophosphatase family protein [Hyphomonas sp. NPDC076900]|uniref:inositol monophosphatase family protein n=1 Tax=unclassified Hyphomonas TaxID=2630699 RepID=UPI003CFDBED5
MSVAVKSQPRWMTDEVVAGLVSTAILAADAARDVILPLFRACIDVQNKIDGSPATEADRRAEICMRKIFADRYPNYGLCGEEFGYERPEASLRWVLDPLDGTRAFITGRPTFGTLIALMDEDRPVLGIIDQPVTRERWIAVAGQSTTYTSQLPGRVGTRKCDDISQMEMSCTAPDMVPAHSGSGWSRLASSVRRVSWGGDCYAYGLLSLGHIDLIAEGDLKLWDWAAVKPIIEGAGGILVDWQGNPPLEGGPGQILALANPAMIGPVTEILNK